MPVKLTFSDPKKEFLNALYPLRRITWISYFIKSAEQSDVNMPIGEHANTERFILGLAICFCLFEKNHAVLMKHGVLLKKYVNKYAEKVPETEAPLVNAKLSELINRVKQ